MKTRRIIIIVIVIVFAMAIFATYNYFDKIEEQKFYDEVMRELTNDTD